MANGDTSTHEYNFALQLSRAMHVIYFYFYRPS